MLMDKVMELFLSVRTRVDKWASLGKEQQLTPFQLKQLNRLYAASEEQAITPCLRFKFPPNQKN